VAIVAACGVACSVGGASIGPPDVNPAGGADASAAANGLDAVAPTPKEQTTCVAVLNTGSVNTPWPFRLCIEGVKRAFPADAPMPQANYPGVPVGGVAVLTAAEGDSDSDLRAFLRGGDARKVTAISARDIANNPTYFSGDDCSKWFSNVDLQYPRRFEVGTITVTPGAINLIVVGDVNVKDRQVTVPQTDDGWIVGNFSAAAQAGMTASLEGPDAGPVLAAAGFGLFSNPVSPGALAPFDAYHVRVTAPFDRSYSLAQITAATDSTKTPGALLSSKPVALLFVGDDAPDGGPGTEAHFVALPLP